jgi:transcriptional regulator with XRE-family HTH domain
MTKSNQPESGFAERLKALRGEAGLSQRGLAKLSNVFHTTIDKLERNLQGPTWVVVLALARALGVTPDAFLGPDDLKEPPAEADGDQDEDRATKRPTSKKS